ncbi:hypothetical protein ACOI9Q_00515 [Klebsiella sp. C228]|uniref:hypothetical protein n=1 Tax=Klebsiella sp. C228 TaxID=3409926 RepID=UPI003B63909A
MAITDTQQTAQFAASAAVSAAEAKQYALSIEKPLIDISESVSEAKDAAVSSELARDEAKDIASGLSESINFELAEKEAEFESQMQGQRTAFEVSQQDKESDFLSSQSQREADFVESQTDRENRFQTFLDSSGYVFLGDYEDGPFQFSARNQYIRYNNQYYHLNAATDVGFATTGTDATSFANDVTHFVLMDGDTLRQNLGSGEGFKLVGQFGSVDELRGYSPSIDGESVLVKSYNPGWAAVSDSPRGGGEFYYNAADTTSDDDGVFTIVTTGGQRFKRRNLNGTITLAQAGAPVDGISNADEAFSRLHSAIMGRSDLWRVDGENLTYTRTTPLLQDISRYSINNMYLMFDGVTDFSADTPFYAYRASDSLGTSKRTFTRKMKNVTFHGPGYRIDTNIHCLLLHMESQSESLRQMKFENVNVRDFNKGHVYGDHAYLITFENCNIWRCFTGLSDREMVEGVTLTDSGENISYVECLLDSLHQCAHLGTQELNITFDTTSFDYTGRTSVESFIQWVIGGTHEITLRDCFIESGNINAGWYNYGFYTTAAANIRIIRGIIRLVSSTYNTCPSFFYDASGLASFEIDGTTINGWGVQQWANTGLRKFRPTLKGLTSQFTLHTTDDPILWNPTKVNNLDYQVRALTSSMYTDKYTNERIKVVPSTITKEDGTVIPTLLITKLAGYGQFADFIVKVRKPVKADHNASMHGKITFVPGTAMSSARVITAITGCCTPGKVNSVGVMTEFASTTITSTQLSLLDSVNWYDINTSWGANKSASFLTFEEDMIRLDLSNLALGDAIHVHSLQWFGAF